MGYKVKALSEVLFLVFKTKSDYVAQVILKLYILLSQIYNYPLLCLTLKLFFNSFIGAICICPKSKHQTAGGRTLQKYSANTQHLPGVWCPWSDTARCVLCLI